MSEVKKDAERGYTDEELAAAVDRLAALSHPAPDVPGAEEVRRVQIRTAIQDLKREARFLAVVDARDKALSLLSDVLVYLMPPELNTGDALEEIRGRHAEQDLFFQRTNSHPPHPNAWKEAHTDRATLLRLLDAAREELRKEQVSHLKTRVMLTRIRQKGDGWQDISTAPKDGTQILACALLSESLTAQGHVPDISIVKWDRDDWVAMADGYHAIKSQGDLWTTYHEPYVTHWQPLPTPLKGSEG